MSFSKTISVFAALTGIFGTSVAAFKLVHDSQNTSTHEPNVDYQQHIDQLQEKIVKLEAQTQILTPPPPVTLPEPTTDTPVEAPKPVMLPAPPPPPPPLENDKTLQSSSN